MINNPFSQPAQSKPAISNPFAAAAKPSKNESNPFGSGGVGDAARAKQNSKRKGALTDQTDNHGSKRKGGKSSRDKDAAVSDSDNGKRKRRDGNQKSAPNSALTNGNTGAKQFQSRKPRNENGPVAGNATDGSRPSSSSSQMSSEIEGITEPPSVPNSSDPHAKKVYTQLHNDGIGPPNWPSRPGDPRNKASMAKFRERYEGYRAKVRASLTKAGLIDDPKKRRTLENAIAFRGICEDMCPEFEKIQRITELDVVGPEKDPKSNIASTQRMVKKLARSAAGQEAPLPMDVRSVPALRRTLDYLIDDLLKNDQNLPGLHGFLWDRTRAIRRDFAFFSSLSPDELKTQIYVLENIARFHVTALHLLSQTGNTPEDFVEQQELEQLGKALLSLRDLYDDCNEQGIVCENEPEFRAYYLVFHAHDPNIMEVLQRQWSSHLWKNSDEVRTAVSLVEALQNTKDFHGPLKPAPALAAGGPLHSYFRIVEDQAVSYTMACFAECHFASLRRSMLIALVRALARPKDETKDVDAEALNRFLRFDTVDEAIKFAEAHDLEFEADPESPTDTGRRRMLLRPRQQVPHIRLQHQYSQKLVEKKRGSHTLPNVIHNTIFSSDHAPPANDYPKVKPVRSGFQAPTNTADLTRPAVSNGISAPPAPSLFQPPAQASSSLSTGVGLVGFPAESQPGTRLSFPKPQPPATSLFPSSKPSNEQPALNPFASAFQPPSAPKGIADTQPPVIGGIQPTTASETPAVNPFASAVQAQPSVSSELPKFPSFQNPGIPASITASSTEAKTVPPVSAPGSVPSTQFPGKLGPNTTSQPAPALSVPATGFLSPSLGQKPLSPLAKPSGFTFKPTDDASQKSLPAFSEKKTETPSQNGGLFASLPTAKAQADQPTGVGTPAVNALTSLPGSSDVAKSLLTTASMPQPSVAAALPPAKPASPPPPPRDLMGDFTKWFVLGDAGILEEFQAFIVEDIVKEVYDTFAKEQEEKKRREEEEAANAEADRWRVYNLRLKFFYRWKRNARIKRQRFLLRSGREQMREFWESQREAERQAKLEAERKAVKEKKELARKANVDHAAELLSVAKRRRTSRAQDEEDLLSSGVLSGVKNEREAAARIVRQQAEGSKSGFVFEKPARPSSSRVASKEGAKTRALREQLLGIQPAGFRRSLPSSPAKSSTSPTPPKHVSRVSERWRLKAMGFVQMPDGSVLPESIADEVLASGKRFWTGARASSYNQSAFNVSRAHASSVSRPRASSYSTPNHNSPSSSSQVAGHLAPAASQADHELGHAKRKRSFNDDGELMIGDAEQSRPHKRTVSDLVDMASKVRNQHQEIKAMLDDMMGDELSEKLQSEINSRGTTPWEERF